MELGLTLPIEMLEDDVLSPVAARGCRAIELTLPESGLLPSAIARVRRACVAHELKLRSVCAGWHMSSQSPLGWGLANVERRSDTFEALVTLLDCSVELGVEVVLLPFFGSADLREPEVLASIKPVLRKLGRVAQQLGLRIGIESTLRAAQLSAFIDEIGSPAIGVYYDAGNAMCLGYDPVTELRQLSERVVAVHLKEFTPDAQWKPAQERPTFEERLDEFRWLNLSALGKGALPVRSILEYLRSVQFSAPVTIEMFPCSLPSPLEAAVEGLSFVRQIDDLISRGT